jgi:glycosyltransferase involved in cell wall biosynthesis
MKILHIANGYVDSSLYRHFFTMLGKYPLNQAVFIPIRKKSQTGILKPEVRTIETHYRIIVNSFLYRLFFHLKIRKELEALSSSVNISEYQIIHAHTLFSDGAVANALYKKFNIPYIIAVRNTDINVFLKYLLHLKRTGREIILNSEKIIFLSISYKTRLVNYYKDISDIIEAKSVVIPNGIDEFWYNNKPEIKIPKEKIELIFAGEIRWNKNIHNVIKAIERLMPSLDINFNVVGEGLNDERWYLIFLKWLILRKPHIRILKAVPKEELILMYKAALIFIMPSFKESFGLVYAEALSQNIPVIYSNKEGFDGWFDAGKIGYPVDPRSSLDIADKIMLILDNYYEIQTNIVSAGRCFSWNTICEKYYDLYNNIILK